MKLPNWKRAVIKIGSAMVSPDGVGPRTRHLLGVARFMTQSHLAGKELILVSSGAVACGISIRPRTQKRGKPTIPEKQALAALGQTLLMETWGRLLDFPCAQLLLTHDDLRNRKRFVNTKNTIHSLLDMAALPIVNENDTVAVDELKVGDNDNLAAHVAVMAEADLLIILSDVDGLFEADPIDHPDAALIPHVPEIDAGIFARAGGTQSKLGTGGMTTKIQAAQIATTRGIDTVIANGHDDKAIDALLAGHSPGTLFSSTTNPLAARKHWLLHTLPVCGQIEVDPGAAQALCRRGASLLPSGVHGTRGEFQRGDAVEVVDTAGTTLGKGICQYSAANLSHIRGRKSSEIPDRLGFMYTDVVIHRSDLVILEGGKTNV